MASSDDNIPWEGKIFSLASRVAIELHEIRSANKYGDPIDEFFNDLLSELIDWGFSKDILINALNRCLQSKDLA